MTNKCDRAINLFVKNIIDENYAKANEHLHDAINEKIKDRIRACDKQMSTRK